MAGLDSLAAQLGGKLECPTRTRSTDNWGCDTPVEMFILDKGNAYFATSGDAI